MSSSSFNPVKLIGPAIVLVVILIVLAITFGYRDVPASRAVLKQHYRNGINPSAEMGGKTFFYNKWTEDIIQIDMSGQVFVTNALPNETHGKGRGADVIELKSSDNQKVHFSTTTQWHRRFDALRDLNARYPLDVEENLIRPELIRIMTANGTVKTAIELYSGTTLEAYRLVVEKEMRNPEGALGKYIVIDNFVIDKTDLPDAKYVENIEARQRASIAESRFKEEAKANQAEADATKIKALIEQNQKVVAADTAAKVAVTQQEGLSKQNTIKAQADALNAIVAQEAESKKIVLQAEADAKKTVATAEAAKQAEIARAVGIEAVGKAEAEAQKLRLAAYSVPGSDNYTRIEVAKQLATAFTNVKGYLPANMTYTLVGSEFQKSVNILAGQGEK